MHLPECTALLFFIIPEKKNTIGKFRPTYWFLGELMKMLILNQHLLLSEFPSDLKKDMVQLVQKVHFLDFEEYILDSEWS